MTHKEETGNDPKNGVNIRCVSSQQFCHLFLSFRFLASRLYRKHLKKLLFENSGGQRRADDQKKDEPHHKPNQELVSTTGNKLKDACDKGSKAEEHYASKYPIDKEQLETFTPEFGRCVRVTASKDQIGNKSGDTAHEQDKKNAEENQDAAANADVFTALEWSAAAWAPRLGRICFIAAFETAFMIDICGRRIHRREDNSISARFQRPN